MKAFQFKTIMKKVDKKLSNMKSKMFKKHEDEVNSGKRSRKSSNHGGMHQLTELTTIKHHPQAFRSTSSRLIVSEKKKERHPLVT